jgi:CO/xanthine dehydrogenase Mo-binding subunit
MRRGRFGSSENSRVIVRRLTPEGAATHYRQADAIARELGMRPLQARCHLALAELHANAGNPDAARAELAAADTLFAAMASWRTRVSGLGRRSDRDAT